MDVSPKRAGEAGEEEKQGERINSSKNNFALLCAYLSAPTLREGVRVASRREAPMRLNLNPQLATNLRNCVLSVLGLTQETQMDLSVPLFDFIIFNFSAYERFWK